MVYLEGIRYLVRSIQHLGKSRTLVKKLKAAEVEDLHQLVDKVKDAKMIIIHTGLNNLQGKSSSADSGKGLIESIT